MLDRLSIRCADGAGSAAFSDAVLRDPDGNNVEAVGHGPA